MAISAGGHEWDRVDIIVGGPVRRRKAGKRCRRCGVKVYQWCGRIRWRYADGRLHDNQTIDEATCAGAPAGRE